MTAMDDIVNMALRHLGTDDLVEELRSRYDEVELSGVEYRMDQQIESEATGSPLTTKEIKRELAKHWLEVQI